MAKKIINLSKPVYTHTGQPIVDESGTPTIVRNVLANIMALGDAGTDRAAMASSLAVALYKAEDELVVEKPEYDLIESMLSQARLANVARAACMEVLESAEDIKNS